MILSKKYKDEMDLIIMDEEAKKRILHNTLNLDKQFITFVETNKNRMFKRVMGTLVACLSILVCLNLRVFFFKIFSLESNKQNDNNIEMKHNEHLHDDKEKIVITNTELDTKSRTENKKIKDNTSSSTENINNKNDSSSTKNQNSKNDAGNSSKQESYEKDKYLTNNIKNPSVKEDINKNETAIYSENNHINNTEVSTASYDIGLNDSGLQKRITIEQDPLEIKQFTTIEEAENNAEFEFKSFTKIPLEFNIFNISVIPQKSVQIDYKNSKNIMTFLVKKNNSYELESYNLYDYERIININKTNIILKGYDNNLINNASWNDGNNLYSISFQNPIDESDLNDIINSIY